MSGVRFSTRPRRAGFLYPMNRINHSYYVVRRRCRQCTDDKTDPEIDQHTQETNALWSDPPKIRGALTAEKLKIDNVTKRKGDSRKHPSDAARSIHPARKDT